MWKIKRSDMPCGNVAGMNNPGTMKDEPQKLEELEKGSEDKEMKGKEDIKTCSYNPDFAL